MAPVEPSQDGAQNGNQIELELRENLVKQKMMIGHSNLVVILSFMLGLCISALPLSILLAQADTKVNSDTRQIAAQTQEIDDEAHEMEIPEYDWSFEGECSTFNASNWGPDGYDPKAFSFEFLVHQPHLGIAITNTMTPTVPHATVVTSNSFFNHMYQTRYNAILRVHRYNGGFAVQIPFMTTAPAAACTNWPPGWEHTVDWSCAKLEGQVLLGKAHKDVAEDESILRANCSLFVDMHTQTT